MNATVTFPAAEDSDTQNVRLAVWKFPDGTTPEEIHDEGILNVVPGNPIVFKSSPTVPGEEYDPKATFTETGQHGINCFEFPGPSTETDNVVLFTVNG